MKPARIRGALAALTAALPALLFPSAAAADPAGDLRKDISLVKSFCSPFTQKVTGLNGETVQEGSGSVCVSKEKSSFRVETKAPDENLVVSDGKSVWSYDPFMQQVTIASFSEIAGSSPLGLIASDSPEVWKKYQVKHVKGGYELSPAEGGDRFELSVSGGSIAGFEIVSRDGRRNSYRLGAAGPLAAGTDFSFEIPKGTEVDDRRGK